MTTLEGRPAPPDIAQIVRHAALEAAMVAFIEGRTEDARELLKRAQGPAARGTTPVYHLPWPILPDDPNVPADIQALAEAVEHAFVSIGLAGFRIEAGSKVATSSAAGIVTIPLTAVFSAKPMVVAMPGDSLGLDPARTPYVAHPAGTTTMFQVGGLLASTAVRINYLAIGTVSPVTALAGPAEQFVVVTGDEPESRPS